MKALIDPARKQLDEDYYNQRPNGGDRMRNWFDLKRALQYSKVVLPERPRILDLGCASGVGAAMMAEELNAMVVGVDFSFARIKRGMEHRNELVFFHLADIYQFLTVTEQKFNMITMFDVLEHLDKPDELIDLALLRLLPGGIVFARVPIDHTDPAHVWVFKTQNVFHNLLLPTRSFEYNNGFYGVWEL